MSESLIDFGPELATRMLHYAAEYEASHPTILPLSEAAFNQARREDLLDFHKVGGTYVAVYCGRQIQIVQASRGKA